MKQLKVCGKCHHEFWVEYGIPLSVDENILCEKCRKKWHKFFHKNFKQLEKEYPEEVNPTWKAFMGELYREKEVIQFT
jgi:hypothetical protein